MFSKLTGFLASLALIGIFVAPAASQVDVRNIGHFQGSAFAPVQIVEFADMGCSACGLFHRDVKPALLKEYVESGRVGWRMIPIRIANFRHSAEATWANECAAAQDGYFLLEQALYDAQRDWQGLRDPREAFERAVRGVGLDVGEWRNCYRSRPSRDPVEVSNEVARQLGIRGTPTFFINGQRVMGALPEDQMAELIETAEARAFQ